MNTAKIFCGLIAICLVGCDKGKSDKFVTIENGFGYGGHSEGFPDKKSWAGLQYRDQSGKTINVWGYLSMASPAVQITNNLAIILGGVYDDKNNVFHDRLLAYEAPNGPPIDLTSQIWEEYSKEHGVALSNIVKDSFVALTKTNDALRIDFVILRRGLRSLDSIDDGDGVAIIPWVKINFLMQDVKKNGKLKVEKWSGMKYLIKD